MTQIPLDKERGIDPHLCKCINCGGDSNSLTVGVIRKGEDENGVIHYANRGQTDKHNAMLRNKGLSEVLQWETVTDTTERIPMGLCTKCEEQEKLFKEELEKGGIFFRCKQCEKHGMIIGSHQLSIDIREHSGIKAPDPVGTEFITCKEHGEMPCP